MDEREACALLKTRFEAAGYRIAENVMFDEDGVRFDIDGFDADARVGYEYLTDQAGDSWDVDTRVQDALADRMKKGEVYILVVDETAAPDAATLGKLTDAFLANIKAAPSAPKKKAAPHAKKPPPTPKKAAGKKSSRR